MIPLREAARRLIAIAAELRDVAGRLDGVDPVRWACARDLRATAATIEAHAAIAEREGIRAGEADPEDVSWVAGEPPGVLSEMFGR